MSSVCCTSKQLSRLAELTFGGAREQLDELDFREIAYSCSEREEQAQTLYAREIPKAS